MQKSSLVLELKSFFEDRTLDTFFTWILEDKRRKIGILKLLTALLQKKKYNLEKLNTILGFSSYKTYSLLRVLKRLKIISTRDLNLDTNQRPSHRLFRYSINKKKDKAIFIFLLLYFTRNNKKSKFFPNWKYLLEI